jgi:hypothetical protein
LSHAILVFVFCLGTGRILIDETMVKNYLKLMLAIVLTSQAMAQAIPSNVPKDGLVGWWPFNGNANDESGNGNHGTVNGATLTSDRNGKENSAYSFDGFKDYMSINKSNSLNINSEITISVWFKLTNWDKIVNTWASLISKSTSPSICNYRISINTKEVSFIYKGKDYNLKYDPSLIKLDVWNNIVVLVNDNTKTLSIFINNSKLNNNLTINNFSDGEDMDLEFGRDQPGATDYFYGSLDDIAIYNRALSKQEIKQLYEGCPRETATLNPTNGVVLKNSNPITLSASPSGGVFKGKAILNGDFTPKNATLGSNSVDYHFINSQGCKDSTQFKVVVYDTLGTVCSSTDTLKIKFQLTTGIKAGQLTAMNVYPNPTSDVLIIEASDVNALKNYTYRIVNLDGKEVYKNSVIATKTEISLKTLGSKGIYVLHILDENGTSIENKKIVLE